MNRNLDICYFRVLRDGKGCSVCFSDLTWEERKPILAKMNEEELRSMCCILADSLRSIGDQLNLRIE